MNQREQALKVLNYEAYESLPIVHFGFWNETLDLWASEWHITLDEAKGWGDGNTYDISIGRKLGFDFNWYSTFPFESSLKPSFERHLLRTREDGSREIMNSDGVTVLEKDEAG